MTLLETVRSLSADSGSCAIITSSAGFEPGASCFGRCASDRRPEDPARREELIARLRELVAELRYLGVADRDILALMGEGSGQ